MKEIEWYFPRHLDELPALLTEREAIPHGGGTGILMKSMRSIAGLVDLSDLPLHFFHRTGGRVEVGATLTFAEIATEIGPDHILSRALGRSASTPLRNRITLGGSIAFFPSWSDLMGPLIALDAEVTLIGGGQDLQKGDQEIPGTRRGRPAGVPSVTLPLVRYLSEPAARNRTLITGISFAEERWDSHYHRHTSTRFDYPAFTVSVLMKKSEGRIHDLRCVVVGCRGKFARLWQVEESLRGKRVEDAGPLEIPRLSFTGKKRTSPEYLEHCARVEIGRGIDTLLRR
jgi:CO/xanthine dehydrogenase FAD-binding subunit